MIFRNGYLWKWSAIGYAGAKEASEGTEFAISNDVVIDG